jgi:alpha-2-macroglobulin
VDALPYLVEYPHGCTEQTLNRFLPTVITMRTLQRMKVDLADVQKKRTNLNAAELGDAKDRAAQWKRYDRNPVFDEAEVKRMTTAGVTALTNMQCSDGGWGWFSGWGEHSWPHTTAVVVHGLQIARENDIALVPNVLERGIAWLENYQARQVQMIENAPAKLVPWKEHADELDAMVYMVLRDADKGNDKMRDFLYRDRTKLAVHAKAMFGLALHKEKQAQKLAMILENISQFVVEDEENQTAYLKLPAGNRWWTWYGSEIEANAYYLKLLSKTTPKDKKAAGLVKFLLANRKHATYWRSTRDTATCVEAMADYIKASGEDKPDMTVEVFFDGKKHKEVKIDAKNLFSFDNKLMLEGAAVTDGAHTIEIRRKGTGPVYYNAYLTNFTLEDFITKAGLEVKVNRKYYKLERIKDAREKVPGSRGQAADQKVEKYKRVELPTGSTLKSGDLVEVELEIDSKNDYEYLLFEDPKAAGFEALAVRSGYNGNDMGAYMEVRDDRICFFVRRLALDKHSVSYRLRAEIPGKFSALPAKASAMYAPELKGNSDEIKLGITD